jgi:hypothetical protein
LKRWSVCFESVAIVQLRDGNDHLSANCRQWIVQRLVQTAPSKLTRNDEFDAVTVIMISEDDELVAKQSALEE